MEGVIQRIVTFQARIKHVNLPQLSINTAQLEKLRVVGTFITLRFHGIKYLNRLEQKLDWASLGDSQWHVIFFCGGGRRRGPYQVDLKSRIKTNLPDRQVWRVTLASWGRVRRVCWCSSHLSIADQAGTSKTASFSRVYKTYWRLKLLSAKLLIADVEMTDRQACMRCVWDKRCGFCRWRQSRRGASEMKRFWVTPHFQDVCFRAFCSTLSCCVFKVSAACMLNHSRGRKTALQRNPTKENTKTIIEIWRGLYQTCLNSLTLFTR